MRCIVLLVFLAASSPAWSAEPADPLLGPPRAATAVTADPILDRTSKLVECPTPTRDDWRIAAEFGLPIGLRVQRRLFDTNFWAEAGVGVWWIVPFASTCLRYDCTLLRRERNLFAVRPGVSATLVGFAAFGAGVDSEFIWQHTFGGKVTTELGVRLGMTAVFLGNGGRHVSGVFPVPVATLMWSWQF